MRVGLSSLIMLLFAIFLEIYIIIAVAGVIGGLAAIFLVVFTSVFGYLLIKHQTGNTLASVQKSLMQGQVPQVSMIEAGIVMFGGVLLVIPGFITDIMGLLTLFPPVRKMMTSRILNQIAQKIGKAVNDADIHADFEQTINPVEPESLPNEDGASKSESKDSRQPIEGEYKRED